MEISQKKSQKNCPKSKTCSKIKTKYVINIEILVKKLEIFVKTDFFGKNMGRSKLPNIWLNIGLIIKTIFTKIYNETP